MITDSDIALVLHAQEAYARGDIDAAVVALHQDVEWVEPPEFPDGGARHGPPAVADYPRRYRARWAERVSEPTAHRRGDDIVVAHHVHGVTVGGDPAEATVADMHTLREGKVIRMRADADPAEVLPG